MSQRYKISLVLILLLVAVAIWIDVPGSSFGQIINRNLDTRLGLDLRGGMQVLLEPDLPAGATVTEQELADAKSILENRSNALGVSEVVFQVAGSNRIVGQFPGLTNTDEVIAVLKETGQLEFVDTGSTYLPEGTPIKTDYKDQKAAASTETPTATEETTATETPASTDTAAATETASATETATATTESGLDLNKVYHTVMTGSDLKSVAVDRDQTGNYIIKFELSTDGAAIFKEYTTNNTGKYLAIVLDDKVLSCPVIENPITDGSGIIQGSFTYESANNLAINLRYGSLPVPIRVVQSQVIGPTLGKDSLNKSIVAGLIGVLIVLLFMLIYYRLPGAVANLSIIIYAAITFALYKFIPVTLTLPGIAGLLLSTGSALDANILIFERLKEELRSGRSLSQSIELGWQRAWPSIRDSNIATLITSIILFWFGSSFGASIVKGFAVTLLLGIIISLFTAVVVTRTFLYTVLGIFKNPDPVKWFGA
jgi:preprotein translocase subunit SecD